MDERLALTFLNKKKNTHLHRLHIRYTQYSEYLAKGMTKRLFEASTVEDVVVVLARLGRRPSGKVFIKKRMYNKYFFLKKTVI